MSRTPIEMMMDGVAWTQRADDDTPADDGMPYATHSGVLDLFGHKLRVHRLNTGQTIIDADDFNAFFGFDKHMEDQAERKARAAPRGK